MARDNNRTLKDRDASRTEPAATSLGFGLTIARSHLTPKPDRERISICAPHVDLRNEVAHAQSVRLRGSIPSGVLSLRTSGIAPSVVTVVV